MPMSGATGFGFAAWLDRDASVASGSGNESSSDRPGWIQPTNSYNMTSASCAGNR